MIPDDPAPVSDEVTPEAPPSVDNEVAPGGTDTGTYPDLQVTPEFEARTLSAPLRNWAPSDIAMESISRLMARSNIVGVCSRFQPDHLTFCALEAREACPQVVWQISPTGRCANGDIEPLLTHLKENASEQAVYRLELGSYSSRSGPPGLMHKLLDKAFFDSLSGALQERQAILLLSITHAAVFPFLHVVPELMARLEAACDADQGWIYEASWQREMPHSWRMSPSASAANSEPHFLINRAENRLLESGQGQGREHRLFRLMEDFGNDWVWRSGGGVSPNELSHRFDEALRLAEEDGFDTSIRTWMDNVSEVLASPPSDHFLEKRMLTIVACSTSDWHHTALRRFGALTLFGQEITEDVTVDSEEEWRGSGHRLVKRRRVSRNVPADAAWNARFDHLARSLGLSFRMVGLHRLIQFKDPSCRDALRYLIFSNYPSLIEDLSNRLFHFDAIFHVDPALRGSVVKVLVQLDDFEPVFTKQLIRKALKTADRLMAEGPRPDSLVAHVEHAVFRTHREHALCVQELFEEIDNTVKAESTKQEMRDQLLDANLWERDRTHLDALLLRTEVLLALPSLDNIELLKDRIDHSGEEVFQPLLQGMLNWPRFDSDKIRLSRNRILLLIRIAPWMRQDCGPTAEKQRSRLLAQSIWVARIAAELRGDGLRYCTKPGQHSVGNEIFTNRSNAAKLLPGLMHIRWVEAPIGGTSVLVLRQAIAYMLLKAPERGDAAVLITSHEAVLIEAADGILFKPRFDDEASAPKENLADSESLGAAYTLFRKYAAQAYDRSSGDPEGFDREFKRLLKENPREAPFVDELMKQAVTAYEEFGWPLNLMNGLALAHWCFEHTGIDVDADKVAGGGECSGVDAVRSFLDTLVDCLRNEPAEFQPSKIADQWKQCVRLLGRLCEAIGCLADTQLPAADRRIVINTLKTKQQKLHILQAGLAKRISETKKGKYDPLVSTA